MEDVQPLRRRHSGADAIETLWRVEFVPMVRLAFNLIGDNAEAEEVVQDSFAEVHRLRDEIRAPGAYLRTTVVMRCRTVLRRRHVMRSHPPEPPADLPDFDVALWNVVQTLPDDQRVAVVLKYYGRYRASEIGKIMDMPSSTVRSHLKRGLATLRKELES